MKIYNSQTKVKEEFQPLIANKVQMYVCGPTLYSDIHIGNARPIVFFDVVNRCFNTLGYDVTYVSNITDIDDKIINKAQVQNISEEELVATNLQEFNAVLKQLNLLEIKKRPQVTEYIKEIIIFIEELISKDYAYIGSLGDIYFRTEKIKEYGEISGRNLEEMLSGTRVEAAKDKEKATDFVLWKKTKVGIVWDAPFGTGRPGWHSECVVMIRELFGNQIDIHGGGVDLKFPHHENENAQNIACSNKGLARTWMHNGFVNVDEQKMSKSLNNFLTVKDLLKEYSPNVLRLVLLQTNYRQPINLNSKFLLETKGLNDKLQNFLTENPKNQKELLRITKMKPLLLNGVLNSCDPQIKASITDDFNTPNLITLIINILKNDNKSKGYEVTNTEGVNQDFVLILYLLGIKFEPVAEVEIPLEIYKLVESRNQAKKNKDFQLADKIKSEIIEFGYEVKDTRTGTEIKLK